MERKIIATGKAPAAIGPYAQANVYGNLIFVSGQIPLHPSSGDFHVESVEDQTEQCLKNLSAILEAAGSSLDKVLKTTVFLTDMSNFAAMNVIYELYFRGEQLPSRSTVEVSKLPKEALVEIEAIAYI